MINVGDDGDISEVFYHGEFQSGKRAQVTRFTCLKQCFLIKNSRINEGFSGLSGRNPSGVADIGGEFVQSVLKPN